MENPISPKLKEFFNNILFSYENISLSFDFPTNISFLQVKIVKKTWTSVCQTLVKMGVAVMTEIMAIIVPVYPDIWEHIVKRMLQFAKQVIQFLFEIFVLPLIYLC